MLQHYRYLKIAGTTSNQNYCTFSLLSYRWVEDKRKDVTTSNDIKSSSFRHTFVCRVGDIVRKILIPPTVCNFICEHVRRRTVCPLSTTHHMSYLVWTVVASKPLQSTFQYFKFPENSCTNTGSRLKFASFVCRLTIGIHPLQSWIHT